MLSKKILAICSKIYCGPLTLILKLSAFNQMENLISLSAWMGNLSILQKQPLLMSFIKSAEKFKQNIPNTAFLLKLTRQVNG